MSRNDHTGLFRKPWVWFIGLLMFFGLTADFLANDLPVWAVKNGNTRFPALEYRLSEWGLISAKADLLNADLWEEGYFDKAIFPPIRFSPNKTDPQNDRFRKPHFLRKEHPPGSPHFLGTDELGHDVASVLIHGCRISLFIGILSMALAAGIGVLLGAAAGFWGDAKLKLNPWQWLILIPGVFFSLFYLSVPPPSASGYLFSILLPVITSAGIYGLAKLPGKKLPLPLDFALSRVTEWMVIFPKLILILAIAAVAKPSVWLPALVIGFTSWPSFLRFTRAEMYHVRQADYIKAAETFGLPVLRIFFRHALPNSLGPVPSLLAFGIAGAVLAESSLSFLGIGLPPEIYTWGKLLAQGRSNPSAWWVTMLPGLLIFGTISSFHRLGETFSDKRPGDKTSIIRYFK